MRTLRTSSIAAIVERLRPLLHIDPIAVLPPEITSQIFSYLAPSILLQTSKVSKSWRGRSLDSRLWKQKYMSEGWPLDHNEVTLFEQSYPVPKGLFKTLSRKAGNHMEERKLKRRVRGGDAAAVTGAQTEISQTSSAGDNDVLTWNSQSGPVEADQEEEGTSTTPINDQEMPDAPDVKSLPDQLGTYISTPSIPPNRNIDNVATDDVVRGALNLSVDLLTKPSPLVYTDTWGNARLNYHHVYKQKRKLEDNWTRGKFKSFQLPHRAYPDDAHTECVYTIQYSGKYLVSGSRDRTLRIWDLDTQRIIRKPLTGHTGSVLCLQFDASEKEDIIVSGSSDTDVIIWQFSTGKMIKKLSRAHRESVLNLKFDNRYLVTCSKDKTIKIWNRNELRPGDEDYPVKGVRDGGKCPAYIIDLNMYTSRLDMEERLTARQKQPLPSYALLMTIDSHGAAVNAVHIHQDQLVSASGDRSLKVWDIHSGVRNAICIGHNKGIACVQYDGKRIVSGSSDDTIRIFDAATQAEVACLKGHNKLVRTVQASFGDEPGSQEELEHEARDIDRAYFEAKQSGTIPTNIARAHRNRDRNAGSHRPENIMAIGAKLPPGGGGSSWARIVSGSYDETIIIWRKASDGCWIPAHKLNQAEALQAAGGPLLARSEVAQQALQSVQQLHNHHTHGPLVLPQPSLHQIQQIQAHMSAQQVVSQAMQNGAAALQAGTQNVGTLQNQIGGSSNPTLGLSLPVSPAQLQAYMGLNAAPAIQQHLPHVNQLPPFTQQLHVTAQQYQQQVQQNPALQQHSVPPQFMQPPQLYPGHTNHTHGQVLPHGPAPGPTHHHGHLVQPVASHLNARVFKLQFDARRLICCSQDPKIVGWDFANGDEEIVECSKFFGTPT